MNMLVKTSSNLYMMWNIGSMVMITMSIQTITGITLSVNYFNHSTDMFNNSCFIFYHINYGWLMRLMHSNLTSMIFIMVFAHMTRSMIYKNFMNKTMWMTGLIIMLTLMMTAFLGYSLVWSQMSFWASMVITNFIMVMPMIGKPLMLFLWGNQFIDNILLNRFFSMHFIMAIMIMMLAMMHLIILHNKKSTNPINTNNNLDQINLNPTLIIKDMIMLMTVLFMTMMVNLLMPTKMNNPDNFKQMMTFKTPSHIEPEWYFLFFYSILRSINNKLAGLTMTILSMIMLFTMPSINKSKFITNKFMYTKKIMNTLLVINIMIITFIGSKTSKPPYNKTVLVLILIYFMSFPMTMMESKMSNSIP